MMMLVGLDSCFCERHDVQAIKRLAVTQCHVHRSWLSARDLLHIDHDSVECKTLDSVDCCPPRQCQWKLISAVCHRLTYADLKVYFQPADWYIWSYNQVLHSTANTVF